MRPDARFDAFVDSLAGTEVGGLQTQIRSTAKMAAFVLEALHPKHELYTAGSAGVGAAWFKHISPRRVHVHSIGVEPGFRRRGIGGGLLRALCGAADEARITLTLRVRPFEASGARIPTTPEFLARWYASFGFSESTSSFALYRLPDCAPQEVP